MKDFDDKTYSFIGKSIGIGILSICIGFVLSMCLYWPKDFRHGVFNKLSEIHATQQANEDELLKYNNYIKQYLNCDEEGKKILQLTIEGYVRCLPNPNYIPK